MNNKKYLCIMLILFVSLISISAISAADDSNDDFSINSNDKLILGENINEDISNVASEELILEKTNEDIITDETKISDSTDLDSSNVLASDEKLNSEINNNEITGSEDAEGLLKDDLESNHLSDENIHINILPENNFLYLSALDSEGNIITEGDFTVTSEDGFSLKGSLYGMTSIQVNLFVFPYDEYPQSFKIDFIDDEGRTCNASYFASLENTLFAHDVVDEFTFEASFLAEDYLPASYRYMRFKIFYETGESVTEVILLTDSDGKAVFDYALDPGNYIVYIENIPTSQSGIYSWNISERNMAKETRIDARIEGSDLKWTILDGLNNPITAPLDFYVNGTFYKHLGGSTFNIYNLGIGPQEFYLEFNDPHYFTSNASLSVDINNTIIAEDSFYNTTKIIVQHLDYEGNPIKFTGASLYLDEELYFNQTDEDGYVAYDLNLLPGKYELRICNPLSSQSKFVSLEVIEEYDAKKASLNVYQDNYKFIVTATDFYGNKLDEGDIQIYCGDTYALPIENGTVTFFYSNIENIYDEETTLTATLKNHQYYPVKTSFQFSVTNTIISNDVRPGNRFNATFLDADKNPIKGMEVVFKLYDRSYYIPMGNLTAITDENGVASVEAGDMYFDCFVAMENGVTYQSKSYVWINKLNVNMTPVADYYDESTGIYYINGHILGFKFDDDAIAPVLIEDEYEVWGVDIFDGYCSIYLLELKRYDMAVYFMGDSKYMEKMGNYTIIASKMKTLNMSISEDLVLDYLDGSKFIVNLTNGQDPISNASVEIIMGNRTYIAVTGDDGSIELPIDLPAGAYDVLVRYKGSPSYLPMNKTTKLTVNKVESILTATDITATYNINKDFIISLKDSQGNPIIDSPVFVDLNGLRIYMTDSNGQIKIGTKSLQAGDYVANIVFIGNKNYESSSATAKVTVKKDSTKMTAKAVSTTYNVNKNLVITLKDSQGKAIKGAKLTVKIGNNAKKYTTDKNGQVKVAVGNLVPKTYTAKISYDGSNNYIKSSVSAKIVVKKAKVKLTAKAKTFKPKVKVKKYIATLKNNRNKAIKNVKLTLKVKGKTYYAKTNNKGQAIFKINGLNVKGKFTAAIKFAGNKYYKMASKKAKINIL